MGMNKEQMQKVAAAEERDRTAAFDLGFAKAAEDAGLTQEQHDAMYNLGVEVLQGQSQAEQ